jgi:PKD repeat protein
MVERPIVPSHLFFLVPFVLSLGCVPDLNQGPIATVSCPDPGDDPGRNCPNIDEFNPLVARFRAEARDQDEGEIDSYLWKFGDGTEAPDPEVAHPYPVKGVYFVQLTVVDDDGEPYTTPPFRAVIRGRNQPPTATIQASPIDGVAPLRVEFYGGLSQDSDPDDEVISYHWKLGKEAELEGVRVPYTFENPGTHEVVLTVEDKFRTPASDKIYISVQRKPSPQ